MGRIVYERRSRGIVQIEMKEEIRRFAEYLEAEKHASENTRVDYRITCNNGNQRTLINP